MVRKSKIETEKQANGQRSEPAAEPKPIGASSKPRRKKATPKKKTVRAIKTVTPRKASSSASGNEPSDEEIRIRAYFIAERRIQLSLQGDSDHDWIEAKRQLIEEAGPANS